MGTAVFSRLFARTTHWVPLLLKPLKQKKQILGRDL
jgi:hypothetical protein